MLQPDPHRFSGGQYMIWNVRAVGVQVPACRANAVVMEC